MKKALTVAVSVLICITFILVENSLVKLRIILTTDPPQAYMIKNLEEQMVCARKARFVFKKPTLRMMRRPYNPNTPHGLAYMDINVIALIDYASYETIAHELGHIIDAQTDRKGHPFFLDKKDMPIQEFADAVGDVILKECRSIRR